MKCEHCEEPLDQDRSGPFCTRCARLLPLPKGASPFAIFGLPERFAIDGDDLVARHRKLSRQLHPDRFTRSDPRDKRRALEWTTALNDALRALRLPEDRAALLLRRRGVDFAAESGQDAPGRLPLDFLESVLEEREALAEAMAAGDHGAAEALAARMKARIELGRASLGPLFDRIEAAEAAGEGEEAAIEAAAEALARLRYAARFLEEAEAFERAGLE